ncbi:hypothetical protein ACIQ9M_34245 [Streptomyces californicus]|uniref:hypothetical protein n=1 Tax=Streptomyces californicus TaxID=67351 RepID=UPI00369FA51A
MGRVPAQVRRGPSAGTSAPEPDTETDSSLREKISWTAIGQIGTAIGAVAAILSVFFTGWATYISAKVAQDQLVQSREESKNEEKQQASRVTFWMDTYRSRSSDQVVHLVNRTPDSVTKIMVHVDSGAASDGSSHRLTGFLHNVPPCTDLTFKMPDQLAKSNSLKSGVRFIPGVTYIQGFVFTDASGVDWIREPDSLTKLREAPERAAKREGSFIIRKTEVKRVEPCDEYGSK